MDECKKGKEEKRRKSKGKERKEGETLPSVRAA